MKIHIPSKKTRTVKVGDVLIGGNNKIAVQSMCNTDTKNIKATVNQIKRLEKLGCEIIRVAIPDMVSARAMGKIKKQINLPLVADIHFDYKLALEALAQGADKIRINPGNIGNADNVKRVAGACAAKNAPIRIGVNAGSLKALKKQKNPPRWSVEKWAQIMVEEALEQVSILNKAGLKDIVVSLKADDIYRTYTACKLFAKYSRLPQHIGITESGSLLSGTVKSSMGLGFILNEGIGDTVRVSLSEKPEHEVTAAFEILKSLGLREYGPEIISCPTCARCQIDVSGAVKKLETKIFSNPELRQKAGGLKIAVMGCVVNGPGEAKTADIGVTGTEKTAVIFKKGRVIKKLKKSLLLESVLTQIQKFKK